MKRRVKIMILHGNRKNDLTQNHKFENFQTKFRLLIGIFLFILPIVEVGCFPSIASKDQLSDVATHPPPDVQLGPELILFEQTPILSKSLIDMNGMAHVFFVDGEGRLNHIEILRDKIITREVLGVIENKKAKTLDAVEHPRGKLRVLSGDKQFFRNAPNAAWQEIKGNRCARFLPVGDDLFCAFITKGEEIHAPERTDYTYGWFLLVPIFYWSHKHVSKLVLAQESPDGWIIRAVVDPDTLMDTDGDFMIGTDRLDNIHILYYTSRGGTAFVFLCAGLSCGGFASDPKTELRYAQLTYDQLLAHTTDAQSQALSKVATPLQWVSVKGEPAGNILCTGTFKKLRPLNRSFSVDKLTGDVYGVEVSANGGLCPINCDIGTIIDLPVSNHTWSGYQSPLIKIDSKGHKHVLLDSRKVGFWSNHYKMHYLMQDGVNWSAPLFLGNSSGRSSASSLATDNFGAVFATWANKNNKFVGRWIRPRNEHHR
jgi:hypothetical protein